LKLFIFSTAVLSVTSCLTDYRVEKHMGRMNIVQKVNRSKALIIKKVGTHPKVVHRWILSIQARERQNTKIICLTFFWPGKQTI